MHLTSDEVVLWQSGFLKLNLTIVTTWAVMLLLAGGSWLITAALDRHHDFALAERAGDHRHDGAAADRRGRPAKA